VRITPVWRAKRHAGRDCRVRIEAGSHRASAVVVPDTDDEMCELPEFLVPYAAFDGRVRVRLDSARVGADVADFDVDLPTPVRQLGSSGPARVVMALVASARAGGRPLAKDHVRFIRETFTTAHPLDDDGLTWLRAWLRELRDADLERLTPEKVAPRLMRHVQGPAIDEVLLWLMRGTRDVWPGAAAEVWIARLGDALGVDASAIARLWAELDAVTNAGDLARARQVLGVGADASEEEIRAAWRRLVQAWHPDRVQEPAEAATATRKMAEINAAYRVLREA
jgi:hypothetical protein